MIGSNDLNNTTRVDEEKHNAVTSLAMFAARSKSTVGRVTISKKVTGPSIKSSSSTLPQLSDRSSFSLNDTFTILVRDETSEKRSYEVKYSTKMVKVMNACDDKRKVGREEVPNNN